LLSDNKHNIMVKLIKKEDPKRILIADDHHLILEGMCSILKQVSFVGEVTAFSDGKSVQEEIKRQPYDAYILDLAFPDIDGFDLIKQIFDLYPEAKIVMATMHEEAWNIHRLLQLGVQAIVLKSSSSEHLQKALEAVFKGKTYFCPRFDYLKKKQVTYGKAIRTKNALPTKRELEILTYIAKGFTTSEIADKLFISVNTVETFRKSLMIKLEAKNVAHLVSIAIDQQLIRVDRL
jgi:Response regulator containing a CheY-like receiver domain and an HTH DNA-binding domain